MYHKIQMRWVHDLGLALNELRRVDSYEGCYPINSDRLTCLIQNHCYLKCKKNFAISTKNTHTTKFSFSMW